VNQISQKELEESEDPCKTIDDLLTKSLKSKEMKRDNKYLDIFFEIINRKLQSQQYVILSILVDYLKIISKIKMNNNLNNLNLYHGMLKPILQLQVDKNTYIDCKDVIKEIRIHFEDFYNENNQLMDKIFEIAIEECCQKNNKMNNNALELLEIFFENWSQLIHGSPRGDIKNQAQKSVRPFSASRTSSKKRGDSLYKKKKSKITNLYVVPNNVKVNIYIPFNLFPKVIILIIKSYEYTTYIDEKNNNLVVNMLKLITASEKYDIFNKDVIDKMLSGMSNKKISEKERLIFLLDFIFDIYNGFYKYEEFKDFCNNYIKSIPIDDTNNFLLFEKLLLEKGFMNNNRESFEFIFEKLVYKIIDSKDLINKDNICKSFANSIDNYFSGKKYNLVYYFETIAKVFIKIFNQNDKPKEKKDENLSKINIINFKEKIVISLTELLLKKNDKNYYNNISNFRNIFLKKEEKEKEKCFSNLYSIWSINPISVLILCIVTENFELAFNIILNLKNVKFNNDIYKILGKLVESFKNEKYEYFWQKLLEPRENIFFIKTLFGILMILPQGVAFDYLSDKLSNVHTLLKIEDDDKDLDTKINNNKKDIEEKIDFFLKKQEDKKEKKI